LNSARLAQVKAAYRIVFGCPVPYAVYQRYEPGELLVLLDQAVRDMKPLHWLTQQSFYAHGKTRLTGLPLRSRILARWQYMRLH
jgi:hypothetical protein